VRIGNKAIDEKMNTVGITELAHTRVGCYKISETSVIIIIIIINITIIITRFYIECGLTRTHLSRYIRTELYIKLSHHALPPSKSNARMIFKTGRLQFHQFFTFC